MIRIKTAMSFSDRRASAKEKKIDHIVGIGNNYFHKNRVTPGKTRVPEVGVQENLEKQLDICFGKSPRVAKTPGKHALFITHDFSKDKRNRINARRSIRDRRTTDAQTG
jgi:hypothetical protein